MNILDTGQEAKPMAPLTTATNANLYYGSSAQLEAGVLGNIDTDVSEEKSEDDEDDDEQT